MINDLGAYTTIPDIGTYVSWIDERLERRNRYGIMIEGNKIQEVKMSIEFDVANRKMTYRPQWDMRCYKTYRTLLCYNVDGDSVLFMYYRKQRCVVYWCNAYTLHPVDYIPFQN